MALSGRMNNIKGLFKDVRTRSIIVLTGILVLFVVFVGITGFLKSKRGEPKSAANTSSLPSIRSVPGIKPTTKQFANLQEKQNTKHYQQAKKGGGSAIPTIITTDHQIEGAESAQVGVDGSFLMGGKGEVRVNHLQGKQGSLPTTIPTALSTPASSQFNKNDSEQLSHQAKRLLATWAKTDRMAVVNASISDEEYAAKQASIQGSKDSKAGDDPQLKPLYKAGDIVFAVLATTINSDYPAPILANIVTGPLKGSKLIGAVSKGPTLTGTEGPERVMLKFNRINIPGKPTTATINAVGIDPDTAYTAVADKVDHHYLLRYGTLFASSFLEGLGNAVQQSGSTTYINNNGGTTTTNGTLSVAEEAISGLGEVGTTLGEQMEDYFDRPPTVYVYAGTSLGILLLSDLTIDVTK